MKNINGLLLGAGASCELAMPLVWELTEEIYDFLTPTQLRDFNNNWKKMRCGYPDDIIELICKFLDKKEFHYESLIGAVELEIKRTYGNNAKHQSLYSFKEWLIQFIYHLLYYRQINNTKFISECLPLYRGIKYICEISKPLWVFSLNHDMNIEIIANDNNIKIKNGFNSEYLLKYKFKNNISEINCDYLSRADITKNKLDFYKPGEEGINLLKLHGSLDIFAKGDEKSYLKLKPEASSFQGILNPLKRINTDAHYTPNKVHVINQITYLDENDEIQFLQRSILTGAYKFENPQVAPIEFLKAFESNILSCDNFYVIGYSFSDLHINSVLKNWLSFSNKRNMFIVDPYPKLPSDMDHLRPQIRIIKKSFPEFLIDISNSDNKKELIKLNKRYKIKYKFARSKLGKRVKKILKKIITDFEKRFITEDL